MIKRALVVEDRKTWRNIFHDLLESYNYVVYEAESYEQAIEIVRQQNLALAVLDVSLDVNDIANRDGIRVLEQLIEMQPETRVIVVSGTEPFTHSEIIPCEAAVEGIIDKSRFDRSHFRALLDKLEGSTYSPPYQQGDTPAIYETPSELAKEHPVGSSGMALVVEDDVVWQRTIADVLESAGLEPVCVSDLPTAWGELRSKQHKLITVDFQLASSLERDNRDGRRLLEKSQALGIPTIIVSGKLELDEMEEDYEKYGEVRIMDKAGFDRKYFKGLVLEIIDEPFPRSCPELDKDFMFKVVQALLRNRLNRNQDIERTTVIQELSKVLDRPVSTFLDQLRETLEYVLAELTAEAEAEEMRSTGVDRRAFPDPGDLTQALRNSLRGGEQAPALWPLHSEWMRRVVVLQVKYSGYDPELVEALMDKMAIQKGAMNRLRKQGIIELADRLLKRWPQR